MSWALGELVPFDVESTGLDLENDRIVTATVARVAPGAAVQVRSHLIAVDVDIPPAATEVHGITTERARAEGKPADATLDLIASQLARWHQGGAPIVGMNLCFDLTLLDRELRRNCLPTLEERLGRPVGPVVDVFVIDKAVDRFRPGSRKLEALCKQYGARADGAHDSEADALAAARVAYHLARRAALSGDELHGLYADRRYPMELVRAFRALGAMSLEELHAAQVGWYAEQSISFGAYLRREAHELECRLSGSAADADTAEEVRARVAELRHRADEVTTDWPMRPAVAVL